jgi:hypothetical protein
LPVPVFLNRGPGARYCPAFSKRKQGRISLALNIVL